MISVRKAAPKVAGWPSVNVFRVKRSAMHDFPTSDAPRRTSFPDGCCILGWKEWGGAGCEFLPLQRGGEWKPLLRG